MRHETLEKYRRVLTAMRDRLSGAVGYVVESIQEDVNPSGNLSGAPVHLADVASEGLDADVHVLETERGMLAEIEAALERVEAGQFGVCQECGKAIGAARLDAIPYAAMCIACARAADGDQVDQDDAREDELQDEIERDATARDDVASESEISDDDTDADIKRPKNRRAGQRRDELLPGQSTDGSGGDRLAAGTAGGGLAAGGLGGTNRGDGSVDDTELENAMGGGQYDDTQADETTEKFASGVGFEIESPDEMQPLTAGQTGEQLEEPGAESAGGAIGGTPANKRATVRTHPGVLDQTDNGSDATIGQNPTKPR